LTRKKESKLSFQVRRFTNFFKIFLGNKRGFLGILILVIFAFLALAAPLLTPYDPVHDTYVSGDLAAPLWLQWIGGTQQMSENFHLLLDPGFNTSAAFTENWSLIDFSENVDIYYNPSVGRSVNGTGSIEVLFRKFAETPILNETVVTISSEPFYYAYNSPPKLFIYDISIKTEGAEAVEAINIAAIIQRINASSTESYLIWTQKYTSDEAWNQPILSSYSEEMKARFGGVVQDPAKIIFNQTGDYVITLRVSFDYLEIEEDVEVKVFIDDMNLRLFGNTYGIFGTDQWGRVVWSQLVYGARISLFVGLLSAFLSVAIGLAIGLISGYIGGVMDESLMRFTDILLVLPGLPLLLVIISVLGSSLWNLIIIIGLLGWMGFARVVRSQVISLKERPFVEAARAIGAGKFYIIAKHILPNVVSLVYVSLALAVPVAILSEAALSFLGLFDPTVVSWGRMLHDAQVIEGGLEKWWWWGPPGICIAIVSISFILLGYSLDELLNPRLRKRR
jgi:peptide/nickel transport system permease protein